MFFVILAILSIIVVILAIRSNLLRDVVVNQQSFLANAVVENKTNPKAPYSWARTQLAFWTVIILSSFLYLLFEFDFSIPGLADVNLVLLGITVATTASAKLIDDTQKHKADYNETVSEGFVYDILSDKHGVSIHRLQNVLWTIVLGIIYVQFVVVQEGLPDETVLSDNLLILMGISTGAYVGIKTTENK
jgi:hypothetical protein